MKLRNLRKGYVLALVVFLLGLGISQPAFAGGKEIRFTRFNIHTEFKGGKNHIASYANFTDPGPAHVVIPAGTEIVILKKKKKAFIFEVKETGQRVEFAYHEPRMGMKVEEYINLITSPESVSLGEMSSLDKEGIAEGVAKVGMTRKGVLVALGYPARHRTPTLDSSTWVYWTNRFGTITVNFDDEGKVKEIVD